MRYLNDNNFNKKSYNRSKIFVSKNISRGLQDELVDLALKNLSASVEKRKTEVVAVSDFEVLSKTTKFRHRNNAIRATFGLKRRGSYDRNVAEIYNQLRVLNYSRVPNVYCYGYKKNSIGLARSTTLITEYISSAFNVLEFLEKSPESIDDVLRLSFDAILNHLEQDFVHLDLWAGNILISEDLTRQWIIDFEYCKFNSKKPLEEKFGFCLGYFYQHTINEYVEYLYYKELLSYWCSEKIPEGNVSDVLYYFEFSIESKSSRKKRLDYFNK